MGSAGARAAAAEPVAGSPRYRRAVEEDAGLPEVKRFAFAKAELSLFGHAWLWRWERHARRTVEELCRLHGTLAGALAAVRDIPLRLVSLVALDPDPSADSQDSRVEAAQEHVECLVARAREALPSGDVSGTVGSGHTLEECVTSLEFEPSEIVLLGSSRLAASHRVFLSATAHRISRALSVPMVVIPRDHVAPVVN